MEINNENIELLIMELLDNELSEADAQAVSDAVAGNEVYKALYTAMCEVKVSAEDVVYAAQEQLKRQEAPKVWALPLRWATGVAAAVAVFMVGKFFLSVPSSPEDADIGEGMVVQNNMTQPEATAATNTTPVFKDVPAQDQPVVARKVDGMSSGSKSKTAATQIQHIAETPVEPVAELEILQRIAQQSLLAQAIASVPSAPEHTRVVVRKVAQAEPAVAPAVSFAATEGQQAAFQDIEAHFQGKVEGIKVAYNSLKNSSIHLNIGNKQITIKK